MGNFFLKPQHHEWYRLWSSQRHAAQALFEKLDTDGDGKLRGPELRGSRTRFGTSSAETTTGLSPAASGAGSCAGTTTAATGRLDSTSS